ncbi:DUF4221 family protein [Cyclobacterium plantarum]|uniref:DUF4221 family protein n=1 Tax=Cyclobacterium plantarum TaxID=2716263 RepID=UPI003F6F3A76
MSCIIFSCGNERSTSTTDMLRIELDTLMVDAGEEILDLKWRDFAISPDGRYLYNFNGYDHTLEKIDMEKLRLVEKLPFEKEGPNGTVNAIYYMHMLDNNHIHLSDNRTLSQFQLNGKRTIKYDLYNNGLDGDELSEYEHLKSNTIIPELPETVFALVGHWENKTYSLRKMNFRDSLITKYEIDPGQNIPKFSFKVPSLSKDPIFKPYVYLSHGNGCLIISADITNEVHLFDPVEDTLVSKMNELHHTASEKTGKFVGTYASMEDMVADYQKVLEDVNFSPPVWDKENKVYYRFSYTVDFEEEKKTGELLPEIKQRNIYLSVYNKDFELLAEAPVPQLEKNPVHYFVRAGDIWIFENIGDELGFIRLALH